MCLKTCFRKRKYATIPSERLGTAGRPQEGERPKREIPEGLMNKCAKCGTIQYSKELEKNLKVCQECGHHMRLNAVERIAMTLDETGFEEFDADMISVDPPSFRDMRPSSSKEKMKSGLHDAVITGQGSILGQPVVVAVMSFDFFTEAWAPSSGKNHPSDRVCDGQAFTAHYFLHLRRRPDAGESILSLMQMAKTSATLSRFNELGGLYISVITDPTTGGVSASFATLGDINIAEPGAVFGFAGRIVIEQTIRQKRRMISRQRSSTWRMVSLTWLFIGKICAHAW